MPLVACAKPAKGTAPSVVPLMLCRTVSLPLAETLKITPALFVPPSVVPIEIAISALNEETYGLVAMHPVKIVEHGKPASSRNLVHTPPLGEATPRAGGWFRH